MKNIILIISIVLIASNVFADDFFGEEKAVFLETSPCNFLMIERSSYIDMAEGVFYGVIPSAGTKIKSSWRSSPTGNRETKFWGVVKADKIFLYSGTLNYAVNGKLVSFVTLEIDRRTGVCIERGQNSGQKTIFENWYTFRKVVLPKRKF